jgi:hypothetical protein
VFHTRWLSFDGTVQAILANLNALITELIADGESEQAAKGILRFITTFSFIAVTHFLSKYSQGLAWVFSDSKLILQ